MELREKITETAGELFVKNGIKPITMDLIAQTMGISKRTIYENFKDKNDLLRTFLLDSAIRHKNQVLAIMKESANVIEALFRFGEFNRKVFEKINPLFFSDLQKYHTEIFKGVMQNEQVRNHEISYTLLKRGVNEGIFVKTIHVELANMFIHRTMDFCHEVDKTMDVDHKVFWNTIYLPYLRGICTAKGMDLLNSFTLKAGNLDWS
jgi:TetR/AcrR family transcriptional regulator, cholesterol catabolism regulator